MTLSPGIQHFLKIALQVHIGTSFSGTEQRRYAFFLVFLLEFGYVGLLLDSHQLLLADLRGDVKYLGAVLVVERRVVVVAHGCHTAHEAMHYFQGVQTHIVLELIHCVQVFTQRLFAVLSFNPLLRVHRRARMDFNFVIELRVHLEGLSVVPFPPVFSLFDQVGKPDCVFHAFVSNHRLPNLVLSQYLLLR